MAHTWTICIIGMEIKDSEIVVRNSKTGVIIRLGFVWIVILIGVLFKDLFGQVANAPISIKLLCAVLIIGFTYYNLRDLMDSNPKLRISKEGLEFAKKKFAWTDLESLDIERHWTKEITYYHLAAKLKSGETANFDITDLEVSPEQIRVAINKLSNINVHNNEE